MKLTLYDVAHGACARLVTPTGHNYFFDSGFAADSTPHPLQELKTEQVAAIEQVVFSNFDEDHVRGLPELRAAIPIRSIHCNRSLPTSALRALKLEESGEVSPAMESAINIQDNYTHPYTPPALGGVQLEFFSNSYPEFQDTNNLSLVTFVSYPGLNVVFPGDLEKAGWAKLLEQQAFRNALARVNVFVASHHGRENGYCAEVFNFCHPAIVVISDKDYMYDTQELDYAKHASGIAAHTGQRLVYSTRHDGTIFFRETAPGQITLTTENGS